MEKHLFLLYVVEAKTFASEKWLYNHFDSLNNNLFDVKIISGNPLKDRGYNLIDFCKKIHNEYRYLITFTIYFNLIGK